MLRSRPRSRLPPRVQYATPELSTVLAGSHELAWVPKLAPLLDLKPMGCRPLPEIVRTGAGARVVEHALVPQGVRLGPPLRTSCRPAFLRFETRLVLLPPQSPTTPLRANLLAPSQIDTPELLVKMSASGAYPISPTPSSPSYSESASPRPDERRRSKRDSTSSQTRQREEAAARYPSPPIGTRSRPQSIEASLQIPPYNPNRRNVPPSPSPFAPPRTRSDTANAFDSDRLGGLMPAPRVPAPHQTTHRPASAAVIPVASPIPPHVSGTSASSRVRQSVGYLPAQSTASGAGPYPQLYTPHPMPRQKIFFGPYILLQTLGEGEFGKVKLGIHSERWGEEVAIKLIKRGNVDTAQRGEKVRREIEVLKVR